MIKELNSTKHVKGNKNFESVVSRHLDYMVKNVIDVSPEQEVYTLFLLNA